MTTEQIRVKLLQAFYTVNKETVEVMQAKLVEMTGFSPEEKAEILGDKKWADILPQFGFEVYKNTKNELAVRLVQNVNAVSSEKSTDDSNIHGRIEKLLSFISKDLKEKDEAMRLALLCAVAGESVFFLGPPGTAKSLVSRRIKNAFKGDGKNELNYFEYLMNQFSTPDEVYGPVSLNKLEEDKYERITDGYLPKANVAFLDEIWKAGPAIQNTLLTIINEKKFHNGSQVQKVPLKALISASNELPAENQGLEALWDRFLLRLIVNPITEENEFLDLVCGASVQTELDTKEISDLQISNNELDNFSKQIDLISVPNDVRSVITAIRQEMALKNEDKNRTEKEKFYVSDRRWKKIVNVLKASAFLNGRSQVDLMDCQLIEYCLWNTVAQIEESKEIVKKCIGQNGLEVDTAIDDINEEIKAFDEYVKEQFYVWEDPHEPKKYEMKNGQKAYKLTEPQEIESYNKTIEIAYINDKQYFGDDETSFTDNYSNCYPDNFSVDGDTVIFDDDNYNNNYHHEFKIEMIPGKFVKNHDLEKYPDMKAARQKQAQEEKCKPILDSINDELKNIDTYIAEKSAPYKANIFADKNMCEIILKSVDKSRVELEKAKSDLKKIVYDVFTPTQIVNLPF